MSLIGCDSGSSEVKYPDTKQEELLETILGKNYEIILKKIVISISDDNLPEWIKKEIKNRNIKALSDFVKKNIEM